MAWAAFFNFVAFLVFGVQVAQTVGTGIVAAAGRSPRGDLRRADGSDLLEPRHLVPRYSVQQFACANRWPGGRRRDEGGLDAIVWQGLGTTAAAHRAVADGRPFAGARFWCSPSRGSSCDLPRRRRSNIFGALATRLRVALLAWATAATTPRRPWASSRAAHADARAVGRSFPRAVLGGRRCQAAMALGTLLGGWRIVHTMGRASRVFNPSRASAQRRRAP